MFSSLKDEARSYLRFSVNEVLASPEVLTAPVEVHLLEVEDIV